MLPWMLRDRWTLFALLTCGLLSVGLLMETWLQEHYAAPITGLILSPRCKVCGYGNGVTDR